MSRRSDFKDISITRAPQAAKSQQGSAMSDFSNLNGGLASSFPRQTKAFKVDSDDDLDLDLRIPRLLPDEFYSEEEKRAWDPFSQSASRKSELNMRDDAIAGTKKSNTSLHPKTAREER